LTALGSNVGLAANTLIAPVLRHDRDDGAVASGEVAEGDLLGVHVERRHDLVAVVRLPSNWSMIELCCGGEPASTPLRNASRPALPL